MSNEIYTLDAEVRAELGTSASRRLRKENKVPAILYGGDDAPVALTLEHNKVIQAQEFEAFYSHVLTLNVDGKATEVLVKDMQRHPYKPKIMHIDFQRVIAGQDVHTNVPLHFVNEEAIIKAGATIAHHVNEIAITCLPKDLPEFIEVDLADIEVGQTLHLSDVTFPAGVTSDELAKGESHDQAVATANAPKGGSDDSEEEATEEAAE